MAYGSTCTMNKISVTSITACLLFTWLTTPQTAAQEADTAHAQLRSNVSFSQVLEVPFAKSDQRAFYGEAEMQFVETWQAKEHQVTTPLIIVIHGGCWLNAYAIDHTYAMNTALRDAGFEVWGIEYRRIGDTGGGWPGSLTDIQAGLQHITKATGGAKALAQRDVTLLGHSAGGHLALLAAAQNAAIVDRTVGLAPITDISTYAQGDNGCQQAAQQFMADAEPSAWQQADPIQQAPQVATYLFHGEQDSIVPLQQSRDYAQQYDAVSVNWLEGAGHFDMIDPYSQAWLTIVQELKQLSAPK